MEIQLNGEIWLNGYNIAADYMDNTSEIEMSDPAHNFFINREYTYGEITVCFLLIAILAVKFWELVLKITKKDDI